MVNYACAFSQPELGKYFEWINWFKLGCFLFQERWIYFSGEFCWYFDKGWNKTQRKRLIWRLEISYGENCFISMFIYNVNRFTFPAVSRDVSLFFFLTKSKCSSPGWFLRLFTRNKISIHCIDSWQINTPLSWKKTHHLRKRNCNNKRKS